MYGIFDTLGAIAKNPNNNSRMLFFGIPKGTFYKKSPLAGFGAEPHKRPGSCMQPSGPVLRVDPASRWTRATRRRRRIGGMYGIFDTLGAIAKNPNN
ncbi:MAG: hypothetical protein U0M20_02345, partial [Christensenellales bacterium]|nr:hypothetical protein [Christensenellales bacterium]